MEEKGELLYELKPKFDFIYEMFMPTGRKMKSALMSTILAIIIKIVLIMAGNYVESLNNEMFVMMYNICNIIIDIAIVFSIILFIVRVIFQVLEYKGISYKFYKDCIIFENTFLNQTRKTIEYSNIREVEIRRTIFDRILNYGVIIIYTNAEKGTGSATVIYAIKDTQLHYNNIESIIHNGNIVSSPIIEDTTRNQEIDLQNAMSKNETYNEINAESDIDPLNKN